jgi:hypothetical protein
MVRKIGLLLATAALGVGAAVGVAACGEDREGDVQFEDGTGTAGTGTAGTATEGTATAETAESETAEDETGEDETETSP